MTRSRVRDIVATLALAALALPAGAAAGDPHVTDACGAVTPEASQYAHPASTAVTGDICSAWFEAAYVDDEVDTLAATIQLAAPPAGAGAHDVLRYQMVWGNGGCRQSWTVQGYADGSTKQYVYEACDGVGRQWNLPDEAVSVTDQTVTLTIPAELDGLRAPLRVGTVLSAPYAYVHLSIAKEDVSSRWFNTTPDAAGPGRDVVL